ncbi:SigB/SigF/SigG family RNA polymerase sigma factor [Actinacidiphila paucisporea]|uniref:RNA polymerase sigma-B factor n=1 Tax=Actinacidiphila paucisporea TaxID=310782 RepID=A0A1M7LRY4_9ACTN|nr:SigB/SigF/SigG family RNA polymerase sigma factor [Actinacidiphila paucisporea]SHM80449.1 RNA polymerase sigma-B factor [Actinacidiphila paucisporea]
MTQYAWSHKAASEPAAPADVSPPGIGAHRSHALGLPLITDAGRVAAKDARELSYAFFHRLRTLEEGTAAYQYVRNTLIEMNLSLVRFAVRRFRHRGAEEADDIFQSGVVGLIKSIDRFDLSREVEFPTFALPTIRGEIMRHLRDTTWAVHVPRRLQEQRLELAKAKEQLEARLARRPTLAELAEEMGLEEAEVADTMAAANGYTAASLDAPAEEPGTDDGGGAELFSRVTGAEDPALELFENCHSLAPLLARLDEREQRVLRMRFGEECTQREIGDALGYSQMHISRLLTGIYTKLRAGLLVEA